MTPLSTPGPLSPALRVGRIKGLQLLPYAKWSYTLCIITHKHPHIHVQSLLKISGPQPEPFSPGRNISRRHGSGITCSHTHVPAAMGTGHGPAMAQDPLCGSWSCPAELGHGQWRPSLEHQLEKCFSATGWHLMDALLES